jgi:anti-sigma regulatory factor (Ser/Thr protein kinase)/predicted transcriptional regulator
MKYSTEKKKTIILYILEKISSNEKSLSSVVANAFNLSTNTVHLYLKELLSEGIIEKQKRGEYKLVSATKEYVFKRSEGDLESDTIVYTQCIRDQIEDLNENVKHIWAYALSEMVNNVIDHSNANEMNVIVSHNYLKTYVLIMDNGVGIFEKIKNYFSFTTIDEAICELFKGKLTTDALNHSGEGIFFTSKMMDTFMIFSKGKVFATTKYDNDQVLNINTQIPGTCVFMALSNFTNKTAGEIFEQYADVDGGFTTTKIPLKNIFDSAPVSRSQAKRICYRLENFEEVILDFENVSWMGQGFAHQIFVVFQNSHPNIKLVAINMNESVSNMYNHVKNTN